MSSFELLQELDMVMRELQPCLIEQDETGNYLHNGIALTIAPEELQKLISELRVEVAHCNANHA